MFITQAKEILDVVPTAKYDEKAASKLLGSIEEEEEQMLEPLLGEELMLFLYERYKLLTQTYGLITAPSVNSQDGEKDGLHDIGTPSSQSSPKGEGVHGDAQDGSVFTVAEQQKTIQLLRNIQRALVYRMLSNKIFSLSTSLNMGGGANRAGAGDYDPADDKHLQEVRKEYYMNSKKACDNILVLLERDAKLHNDDDDDDRSLWYNLWKESDGYYLKEDLLFPTLRSLKPYYPCNEPTRFLSLAPVIRYCQDQYITPRLGIDVLDRLTGVDTNLSDYERKLQKLVRTALAWYVKAKEGQRDERNEALMTADGAWNTVEAYIAKYGNDNVNENDGVTNRDTTHCYSSHDKHKDCDCANNDDDEYEHLSTLFAPGVNRW